MSIKGLILETYLINSRGVLIQLTQDIASMNDTLEQRNVGLLNPADTKIDGRRYYNYVGSLTVPPCTQDVLWIVVEKVIV